MSEDSKEKELSRRSFLDALLQGTVALGVIGASYPVVRYIIPPKGTQGAEVEVNAGSPAEIGIGKAKKFEFNGKPAIVINSKTGFSALSAVCTHLGCIVDWHEDKQQIICPCHNATFDLNGNILAGPPPLPLEKLEVAVRDNKIMVRRKG